MYDHWAGWFIIIWGACILVLLLLVAIVWFVGWFQDKIGATHMPSYQAGIDYVRDGLRNQSYWFSEDPVIVKLIQDLATDQATWTARDNWRRGRDAYEPNSQG